MGFWRCLAAAFAAALGAEQHSDIFTYYKNEAAAAESMAIALEAERLLMAGETPDASVANMFVSAGLRVNDESVAFQVSKILEAFMRRKMMAEAPRCQLDAPTDMGHPAWGRRGRGSTLPRGVIVFILVELDFPGVGPSEDLRRDLELALRCWSRHLPGYPLLVFHTPQVPRSVLHRLSASVPAGARLEFAEIATEFPPRIAADPGAFFDGRCVNDAGEDRWRMAAECGCRCGGMNTSQYNVRMAEGTAVSSGRCWPLAWMHSMRLATASIYRHPALASGDRFDYIALVNADLFLVRPPPVDPFVLLQRCGCALAYDRFSLEIPGCYDGFQELLGRLGVAHPMIGKGPAAIGGQLLVARLDLFRSPKYLAIADHLAEGIYSSRWGDQLFFAAALESFMQGGGFEAWGGMADPAVREYGASYGACLHDMFFDLMESPDLSVWNGGAGPNSSTDRGPVLVHRKASWRDGRFWWSCSP